MILHNRIVFEMYEIHDSQAPSTSIRILFQTQIFYPFWKKKYVSTRSASNRYRPSTNVSRYFSFPSVEIQTLLIQSGFSPSKQIDKKRILEK